MPNNEYPTRLTKADPLTTLHIKVPKSIVPIYNREGDDRVRAASFVMREVLVKEAIKLADKHAAADKRIKAGMAAAARKAS